MATKCGTNCDHCKLTEGDAQSYVDAVLAPKVVCSMGTPPRKRKSSNSEDEQEGSKKLKPDSLDPGCDENEVSSKQLLLQLTKDIHTIHDKMNTRLDAIEERIVDVEKRMTDKITDKLQKMFDKRISSETSKLRNELNNKMGDIKKELTDDIAQLTEKIENLAANPDDMSGSSERSIADNIILRNLPYSAGENLQRKVSELVTRDLGLHDVTITHVERKDSMNDNRPGVVVAKCGSVSEKEKVLKCKSKLKDSNRYSEVFINSDQTKSERRLASSMRAMVRAINGGNKNLKVKGTQVVYSNEPGVYGRDRGNRNSGGGFGSTRTSDRNGERQQQNQDGTNNRSSGWQQQRGRGNGRGRRGNRH